MKTEKPINILTADLIIPDLIVHIKDNEKLQHLVDKYKLEPGGKKALTDDQFKEFSEVVEEMKKAGNLSVEPGGSSANVLVTLSKLLGRDKFNIKYLGIAGSDEYSDKVKKSFKEVGIELLPDAKSYRDHDQKPQSATSFVLMYPNGQRTIVTHPGNARNILKSDMVTEDMIKNSDVVFMQGSLWERFDHDFVNKLTDLRFKNQKELWLALPTHAKFGEENANLFQFIIPSANVILGNKEELDRIYKNSQEVDGDLHRDSIHALRDVLEKSKDFFKEKGWKSYRQPVALITNDTNPAYIITGSGNPSEDYLTRGITKIDVKKIEDKDIVNKLGAGDTSFAGFLTGLIKNRTNAEAAELAMLMAGEKVREEGPRLVDPRGTLRKATNMRRIPEDLANSVLNSERNLVGVGL